MRFGGDRDSTRGTKEVPKRRSAQACSSVRSGGPTIDQVAPLRNRCTTSWRRSDVLDPLRWFDEWVMEGLRAAPCAFCQSGCITQGSRSDKPNALRRRPSTPRGPRSENLVRRPDRDGLFDGRTPDGPGVFRERLGAGPISGRRLLAERRAEPGLASVLDLGQGRVFAASGPRRLVTSAGSEATACPRSTTCDEPRASDRLSSF